MRTATALLALGALLASLGCDGILHLPSATTSPGLACSDGVCSCSAPLTYCGETFDGTCPINLDTDGANCGRCGHDCLGGACSGGACQPVILNTTVEPFGLSLYDDKLWLGVCDGSKDAFVTLPISGGHPTLAISSPQCGSVQALLGSTLYWGGEGGAGAAAPALLSLDLAGTAKPAQVAVANSSIIAPSTSEYFYFSDLDSNGFANGVYAVTLPSGPTTQVATGTIEALAANSQGAYWITSTDGIHFLANGASADKILLANIGYSIFVDEEHVFFSDQKGLEVLPVAGGTPTLLAHDAFLVAGAVYGDELFWVDVDNDSVNSVPIAGGPTTVLAKNFSFCGANGIAVDASAVYFLGGSIVAKVAR